MLNGSKRKNGGRPSKKGQKKEPKRPALRCERGETIFSTGKGKDSKATIRPVTSDFAVQRNVCKPKKLHPKNHEIG